MIFLSIRKCNHIRLRMCNCQLCWQWWAQVESNHRPHAYQACALTFWAMSPCYLHNHRYRLIRRSVSLNLYGFGFATDGGDEGIRTLDPLLAGQVLSQLSYTPILREEVIVKSEEVFFIFHHSFCSNNRFPKGKCHPKLALDVGPWKSNNNICEFRSSSSVLFLCELRVILFQSLLFSIERRWSSRTFRYGYLVTT